MKNQSESKLLLNEAIKKMLVSGRKIDSITISEISNKAGIARRTFYRHFKKIDELIEYSIKEDLIEILSYFKKDNDGNVEISFKNVLMHINYDKILSKQINDYSFLIFIQNAISNYLNEFFNKGIIINEFKYVINKDKKHLLITYINRTLFAIIKNWAERDFIDDIDVLADIISNLSIDIIKKFG